MVAPFTPYSVDRSLYFVGQYASNRRFRFRAYGQKQVPPYISTAYQCYVEETLRGNKPCNAWSGNEFDVSTRVAATNIARGKFVDELGNSSQLGSTLTAEGRSSYNTVVGGVLTILRAAKATRRGKLVEAASLLGVSPPEVRKVLKTKRKKGRKTKRITVTRYRLPNGKEVAKSVGNKWLWWSYGVNPLMGDLYNAVDVLQREAPWTRVRGSGKHMTTKKVSNAYWNNATQSYYNVGYTAVSECKITIAANVRVKNSNLWLANQLGLINPIQMVNEGIMFSFVLDWFSNLSQVISQMTDFVGLEIADPVTSEKSSLTYDEFNFGDLSDPISNSTRKSTTLMRTLTIPSAKLRLAYERFQWQRGANAISLLVQFLKTNKK